MKMKFLLLACGLLLPFQITMAADSAAGSAADSGHFSGKVIETMTSTGYTYVLVDTGSNQVWAAANRFAVKLGDEVSFVSEEPMRKFHSKTLNRDFELIYFTGKISVNGLDTSGVIPAPALPEDHPALTGTNVPVLPPGHPVLPEQFRNQKVDLTGIQPAKDGKTVQQIVAGKAKLDGKSVTVRAKVVKYNGGIMGKNWLHLQDGSGSAAERDNDLTVTTATEAKVGDTVLVTGQVFLNKDFGAGYKYAVILDDAKVIIE
jgi:hypothetical protein